MDSHLEGIYLREICDECEFALIATMVMNRILQNRDGKAGEFFAAAQDFLQHSAAISRIVWPSSSSSRAKDRGAHLQSILGVQTTHELSARTLRNRLEHFDERLDDWAEESTHRNMVDRTIVPRREMIGVGPSLSPKDIFRLFESETLCYIFRGEEFNLQNICAGVQDIQRRAKERLHSLRKW